MLISSKHYSLEHLFKGATPLDHGVIIFWISYQSQITTHMNNTCQNCRFLPNSKTFFTL